MKGIAAAAAEMERDHGHVHMRKICRSAGDLVGGPVVEQTVPEAPVPVAGSTR